MVPDTSGGAEASVRGRTRARSPLPDGWERALLDAAPIGIGVLDRTLRFLYANPRLCEINERPLTEHLGRTLREVVDHPRVDVIERIAGEVLARGVPLVDEDVDNRFDRVLSSAAYLVGAYFPILDDGDVVAVGALVWDASEARRGELQRIGEALARSEDRYRFLVAATSSLEWFTDVDGRIVDELPSWSAFTGQSPQEYVGFGWLDAVHPDDRRTVIDAFRHSSAADSFEQHYRLWSDAHGTHRHVVGRGALRRAADGSPLEWVGVCLDEHEQVLAQRAVRRRREATAALAQLGRALAATSTSREALAIVADAVVDLVGAASTRIELAGRGAADDAAADRAPLGGAAALAHERVLALVAARDVARWYDDADEVAELLGGGDAPDRTHPAGHEHDEHGGHDEHDEHDEHGVAMVAGLPLPRIGGRPSGAMSIVWAERVDVDSTVVDSLETVLQMLREALERLRLHEEEHRFTTQFQQTLEKPMRLPRAVEAAARYVPASSHMRIGGDWYDAVPLSGGRVALVVGDVTGHGAAAAAEMAQLRSVMSTLLSLDMSVGATLGIASSLCEQRDPPTVASALVVELDPVRGLLRHLSAGHPPFILAEPDRPAVVVERPRRPLLGIAAPTATGVDPELALPAGALVVVFTDGLVERRDRTLDEGTEVLRRVVDSCRELPCEQLLDAVLEGCAPGPEDDVAVIAVRVHRLGAPPADPVAATVPTPDRRRP